MDSLTFVSTNSDQEDPSNSTAVKTRTRFPEVKFFDFNDAEIGCKFSKLKVIAKLSEFNPVDVVVMFNTGIDRVASPAMNEISYTALYNAGFNERIGSQLLPPGFTRY